MPNIKSAIKRVSIIAKKTKRNKMVDSAVKTSIKKFEEAVKAGEEKSKEFFRDAVKSVDKAASKGVLHKNVAARKKSKMAKALNSVDKVQK